MNVIWAVIMAVSIVFAAANGRFDAVTKAMFDGTKAAVEVSLYLAGIITLWLGVTKIIEDSGLIHKISHFFAPLFRRLFRNIPPDHPSITSITLNCLANFFGLGNAATPLGLKAMKELQSLNTEGETASFEIMLFIVLNTASIQLIPFTVIGILAQNGSANPSAIVLPTIITSVISAVFAVGTLFAVRRLMR